MTQNKQYLSDFMKLFTVCRERNVAMQTIKSLVHRPWEDQEHTRATWYRPLEEQADIDLAIHWVLGHAGLFLNTAGDVHIFPRILNAAERYTSTPTDEEMQAQVDRLDMKTLFP